MTKQFWIGTSTRPTTSNDGDGRAVVTMEDVGIEVEADNLTIEPSGALTLWRSPDGEHRSTLIMAFAPGNWTKAHVITATLKPNS